jgi:glyceraldehyde-3-phosphate dehydrogenase (NADP+)
VHKKWYSVFVNAMKQKARELKSGNPLKKETTFSVMIDEENARRVESWVNEAIAGGAKLICGGKRKGSFYEATILTHTAKGMKVFDEEVFGPVICIEPYEGGIENAVKKINATKFGLQCGVFTDSAQELDYVFEHAEVGGVIHNHVPTLRFDQMPYGGIKESGLGREGVKYAIQDMLEPKVLVK